MSFYSDLAATALALLADKGQVVTIRRPGADTFDSGTQVRTAAATTDYAGKGALLDYKLQDAGLRHAEGLQLRADDKRLLWLPSTAGAVEPTPKDVAVIGSTIYQVVNVKAVSPAGTPVLFDLQVRK